MKKKQQTELIAKVETAHKELHLKPRAKHYPTLLW